MPYIIWFLFCFIVSPAFTQDVKFADSKEVNLNVEYIKRKFNKTNAGINLGDFSEDLNAKNYLLIIAAGNYEHWGQLYNPILDADRIKKILQKKYGYLYEQMTELYNKEVTYEKVRKAFADMKNRVGPNDNLIIYYSGHGYYDASFKAGYWVPVDAQLGAVSSYIPNSEVLNYIREIQCRHIFLIADACFSGSLFEEDAPHKGYAENVEQIQSRWGLSSGNVEQVSDGKSGLNSPFAKAIIKCLTDNLKDKLAATELIQYVKVSVAENHSQTPQGNPLKGVGHKLGGEFVFRLKN